MEKKKKKKKTCFPRFLDSNEAGGDESSQGLGSGWRSPV